ncbi:MAG: helix-turn-helix transcriptional regulator [Anaerolineae bacterium]|nr:helix-turn-helix transcriptional regulator [Anaerolineae bacterium]
MSKALSDFLSTEIKTVDISERELSRRAGLSVMAVNRIIRNPESTPTADTCIRLAHALNFPVALLLQLAGYGDINLSGEISPEIAAFATYLNSLPPKTYTLALEVCWSATRILAQAMDGKTSET